MLHTYNKSLRLINDTVRLVSEKEKWHSKVESSSIEKKDILTVSKRLLSALREETETTIIMRAQEALIKKGFLKIKTPNGKGGPLTRDAVEAFQISTNGALDVDGKLGIETYNALMNGKKFLSKKAKVVEVLDEGDIHSDESGDSSDLVGDLKREKIFGIPLWKEKPLNTAKFSKLAKQIDSTIDASSGLIKLETNIMALEGSNNQAKIEMVYTQAADILSQKGIHLSDSYRPIEKAYILYLIGNALMGGETTVERRKTNPKDVEGFIRDDASQARAANRVFKSQGFSGTMITDIGAARDLAYGMLRKKGVYQEKFLENTSGKYIFSVRTKGEMNGLQGYTKGSAEILDINRIRITEFKKSDMVKLIESSNAVQFTLLREQFTVFRNMSDDYIVKTLSQGEVVGSQYIIKIGGKKQVMEMDFYKSANCNNDAIGYSFVGSVVVEKSGNNGTGTTIENPIDDNIETGGGDDDDGGDNNGGATENDGENGSNGGTDGGETDV